MQSLPIVFHDKREGQCFDYLGVTVVPQRKDSELVIRIIKADTISKLRCPECPRNT